MIDHSYVTGDLENFPVLISLTDANLGTHAQTDGDDIIFISSNGQKLSHEIESFATSTGVLVAWVKIPSLSSTNDTQIFMYYGNAGVGNQEDAANVWDGDYRAVWHLPDSSASTDDSTINGVNLTNTGASPTDSGRAAGAMEFDGSSGFLKFSNDGQIGTAGTMSFWYKETTNCIGYEAFFGIENDDNGFGLERNGSDTQLFGYINSSIAFYNTANLFDGNWKYIAFTWNDVANLRSLIVNGSSQDSDNSSFSMGNINVIHIGDYYNGGNQIKGIMDEIRISSTIRSQQWLQTEFNNQNSPESFLAVQSEEVGPSPIGYWSMDEGYGTTVHDESGQGNSGTLSGGTWQDESMCISGKCLFFDGTNDYINIPDADSLNVTETTISAWVKSATTTAGKYIIGKDPAYVYNGVIGTDADDGAIDGSGGIGYQWEPSGESGNLGYMGEYVANNRYYGYFRFVLDQDIPSGATIDSATIDIYGHERWLWEVASDALRIWGHDSADAPLVNNKNDYPGDAGGTTLTDASTRWPLSGGLNWNDAGWNTSPDFKAIIQELVDDNGGLTENHHIQLWIAKDVLQNTGEEVGYEDYAYTGSQNLAELTINFSTSGGGAGATDVPYALSTAGGGQFMTMSSSTIYSATSTTDLNDNRWHYVSGTYDGSRMKIYIDGNLETINSNYTGDLPTKAGALHIGADYQTTPDNFFHGFIDEVKVYPYARTADQIKQDYAAGLAGVKSNNGVAASFGSKSDSWMTDGLVGYWKFDEPSTASTYEDSSGNGNIGTANDNASTTAGKFGNSAVFDGANDGVYTSKSVIELNTVTTCAWVNPETPGQFSSGTIIANGSYYLYMNTDSWIITSDARTTETYFNSIAPVLNSWQFVCVVRQADGIASLYVNGVQSGASQFTGTPEVAMWDDAIGNRGDDLFCFDGKIDEVRIYNRALSADEVKKLYEWAPGPVAWWKFDEKSGTTAYDSAASTTYSGGNHGAFGGGSNNPSWSTGKYGGALKFAGNEYIDAVHSPKLEFGTGSFTVSYWMKPFAYPTDQDSSTAGLINKQDASQATGWRFDFFSNGDFIFANDDGTTEPQEYMDDDVVLNQWYYVTGVVDRTTDHNKLYINGQLQSDIDDISGLGSFDSAASNDLYIGAGRSDHRYFDGLIDDVRIYNYARTQKQILEDMNAGGPALKQPVLHLSFDEGYGSVAHDDSIYGNNGTLVSGGSGGNSTVSAMWDLNGKFGKAMEFDGTNDYVYTTNSFDYPADFTVSVWFKTTVASGHKLVGFENLQTGTGSGSHSGHIWMGTDGKIRYGWWTGSASVNLASTATLNDGQWHHAVGTYSMAPLGSLYIDGVLQESSSLAMGSYSSVYWRVGSWRLATSYWTNGSDGYFNGLIDEVKVYNYTLSEDEIKTLYNSGASAVMGDDASRDNDGAVVTGASKEYCIPGDTAQCDPPVLDLDFDEKTGQYTYDKSGHGNNGTLGSGATADAADPVWKSARFCHTGACLLFDDNDDYVSISDNSSLTFGNGTDDQPFSGSAWAYMYDATTFSVLYKGQNDIGNLEWWFGTDDGSDNLMCKLYDNIGNQGIYQLSDTALTDYENTWINLAFTYDGTESEDGIKLYLNGVLLDSTGTEQGTYVAMHDVSNAPLSIGAFAPEDPVYRGFSDGLIDGVKIYNYARTPAQIAWDYNKGAPIAEWDFDECSGSTIHDASGNGNNGQLYLGTTGVTATGTCASSSDSFWYNGKDGKRNAAGSFDNTDDIVRIQDSGADSILDFGSGDSITIGAWVNIYDFTDDYQVLAGKTSSGNYYFEVSPECSNGDANCRMYFIYRNAANTAWREATSDNLLLHRNEWQYVAVSFTFGDPDTIKFYYNGMMDEGHWIGAIGSDAPRETNEDLVMGRNISGGENFNGLIDEVKIWDYALTPEQVKTEYNGGAVKFGN